MHRRIYHAIHDVHPAARISEPFLIKETAKLSDIIEITDFEDPKLDVYARIKEIQLLNRANPEDGIFIAESPKVVERALDAGYEPISILVEKKHVEGEAKQIIKRCGQIPVYTAEFDVLTKITGFKLTRGMLCAMHRRKLPSMREICENAKRIAVLEEVVNPTNIGAIFRSAAAMHITGGRSASVWGQFSRFRGLLWITPFPGRKEGFSFYTKWDLKWRHLP